jgi:hypothetical protein
MKQLLGFSLFLLIGLNFSLDAFADSVENFECTDSSGRNLELTLKNKEKKVTYYGAANHHYPNLLKYKYISEGDLDYRSQGSKYNMDFRSRDHADTVEVLVSNKFIEASFNSVTSNLSKLKLELSDDGQYFGEIIYRGRSLEITCSSIPLCE